MGFRSPTTKSNCFKRFILSCCWLNCEMKPPPCMWKKMPSEAGCNGQEQELKHVWQLPIMSTVRNGLRSLAITCWGPPWEVGAWASKKPSVPSALNVFNGSGGISTTWLMTMLPEKRQHLHPPRSTYEICYPWFASMVCPVFLPRSYHRNPGQTRLAIP